MIYIGDKKLKRCLLGDTSIGKVYLGDTLLFQHVSRLPAGYTEVEYISNPNLGYALDIPNISAPFYNKRFEFNIEITSIPTYETYLWGKIYTYILNSSKKSRGDALCIPANEKSIKCYCSYSLTTNILSAKEIPFTENNLNIIIDNPKGYFEVNGIRESIPILGSSSGISRNPSLFACYWYRRNGTLKTEDIPGYNPTNYIFKSLKIYNSSATETGDLLYEYVPCIDPSGTVGIYELVNGTFAKSADDTKPFVAGPAV